MKIQASFELGILKIKPNQRKQYKESFPKISKWAEEAPQTKALNKSIASLA